MIKNFVVALTLCSLPLAALTSNANAAAAHNIQKGTSTTNANDNTATQVEKQQGTVDTTGASMAAGTGSTPMKKMKRKHPAKQAM